jgi:hypothetical protein
MKEIQSRCKPERKIGLSLNLFYVRPPILALCLADRSGVPQDGFAQPHPRAAPILRDKLHASRFQGGADRGERAWIEGVTTLNARYGGRGYFGPFG